MNLHTCKKNTTKTHTYTHVQNHMSCIYSLEMASEMSLFLQHAPKDKRQYDDAPDVRKRSVFVNQH